MKRILLLLTLTVITFSFGKSQDNIAIMDSIYALSIEDLMNTKVTIATKSEQSVNESPATVSVITAEEIKNMGARELADILQAVPGFELNRNYSGYYTIGARGVKDTRTTSKILFLIDGVPTNQVFFGSSLPWGYDLNIDAIDRVEIIRGPGSALYGRNAFSAVINIINKSAKNGEKLFLRATGGTFNTKGINALLGISKDKLNATIAFQKVMTDVVNNPFNDEFGRPSKWDIYRNNYSANTKISYGNFTVTGSYSDLYGHAGFTESFVSNKITNYSLAYNKDLSSKLFINVKLLGHNSSYLEDIEQLPSGLDIQIPGLNGPKYSDFYPLGVYYKPQSKEYLYGLETELKYKILSNNNLLIGFQADKHGVFDVVIPSNYNFATKMPFPNMDRNNMVNYPQGWFVNNAHDYRNLAFLFQDIWSPFKYITLTIGARYDIDSEIGAVFNPRTGLVITPIKNTNIKLLYGKAYRAPAPSEQFATEGYAIGNKDLKPENINTFELSVSNRYNNINQSISFYMNKLTDMVYAQKISVIDDRNIYRNIGDNTSTGIEYENKLLLSKGLYSYFNYSFTFSENTDSINGKDTTFNHPDVAPHKVNLGVNYSFLKHFNLNVNMFYRSKMERFKIGSSNLEVKDNIGDYAIFNSTIQINDYLYKGLSFKVSVYNMFDKKYYSQDNQHLNQPRQPGRQFLASIVYSIK
jgi:outer membrane receptor for ferrienterochelin and colicins